MSTPGSIFSVPLGDLGPRIETDPLFKGRHQIPNQGNWPPLAKAQGSGQKEAAGLGEPELKPALMHFF